MPTLLLSDPSDPSVVLFTPTLYHRLFGLDLQSVVQIL
jgi:hypothetical protein